jgi:hypothetical protein
MDLPVTYIVNASYEANIANDYANLIRVLRVPLQAFSGRAGPAQPQAELLALIPWTNANNYTVASFSAECWLTARGLVEGIGTGVPVGAIQSDWPGDSIAMLSSPAALAQCNSTPGTREESAADVDALSFPGPIPGPGAPSSQWNAMVAPFLVGKLAVSAFIYHQGEADAMNGGAYYACHLAALINDWRSSFGGLASTAWFGVTQLAPWAAENITGYSEGVAEVREAQFNVSRSLPNVTVAVIDDDGDPLAPAGSVHSRRKQLVAQRLVNGALKTQYGKDTLTILGPTYAAAQDASSGSDLVADVVFEPDTCTGGLAFVYGLNYTSWCPVELGIPLSSCAWFAIQSSSGDGVWVNATATILNGTAIQLRASGAGPGTVAATSFGWGAYPVVTLFNGVGLPVTPWRAWI